MSELPTGPTAFADLKPEDFPLRIEFINSAGGVVHTIDIPSPGVVSVPGLAKDHGPIGVRITFPDGTIMTETPPGGAL